MLTQHIRFTKAVCLLAVAALLAATLAALAPPPVAHAATTLGAALDVNGDLVINSGTLAQPQTEGYWKLDDGSGTTATDSSGNGYDGTLTNTPTWSTDTPSTHFSNPHSLSFDRADADYVNTPSTANIQYPISPPPGSTSTASRRCP
jgi:hypothetical protein